GPTTGALTVPPASVAPRRSPVLARALLLGACALGLAGLAGPAHHPAQRVSAASTMASSIELEPRAPHGVTGSSVVAQRASRSRTVVPAKRRVHVAQWVAPNGGAVVSPFGMRWGRLHKGLDF